MKTFEEFQTGYNYEIAEITEMSSSYLIRYRTLTTSGLTESHDVIKTYPKPIWEKYHPKETKQYNEEELDKLC